jgi:lipoate-protein ligase A
MPGNDRHLDIHREPAVAGGENMRRDTALLDRGPAASLGVLRFYTWARPTISLGYMQRGADLLDLQACQEDGIDIAPRPTGGRAFLVCWVVQHNVL